MEENNVVNNSEETLQGDRVNNQGVVIETNNGDEPGKGAAVVGMVLGIVSIVCWFFGAGAVVGFVTGIIGLIYSSSSKKAGYSGGMQTAGFVCSLIGLIGSALVFVACFACVGAIGTAGLLNSL